MKISSRIEGSFCGAFRIIQRHSSSPLSRAADPAAAAHRTPNAHGRPASRPRQQQRRADDPLQGALKKKRLHQQDRPDFFVAWVPSPFSIKTLSGGSSAGYAAFSYGATPISKRWSHSGAEKEAEVPAQWEHHHSHHHGLPAKVSQDRQEMLSLVDQTQSTTLRDHLDFSRDPYMRGYAAPDGPDLAVSDLQDDQEFPSFLEVMEGSGSVQQNIVKLWRAIQRRLANPYKTDINHIYELYERIPEPRMSYLHSKIRHNLLKVLGQEEKKHRAMLRYFAVVADIQRSGLRLTRGEWNSMISFAARYVGHSSETEVTAALRLWKEMEKKAGIKGNSVTFNILFDVASKAGNFVLAEMLYKEMEKRGLKFNRYHHVSLIHFFGLRMDSDGIRAAYKEMVESGEMIDTVVLNCVIAGFLRCGEEYAAESVYGKMKMAHERLPAMPYRNYMNNKVITKVLMMFATISQQHSPAAKQSSQSTPTAAATTTATVIDDEKNTTTEDHDAEKEVHHLRRHFQKMSPIVPDIQTYRILLNHYAVRLASIDRVAQFLDDMKWFQVPLHGAVFLALFKGFAIHGGSNGQQWSPQRLNSVWVAFNSALDENVNDLYVDVWMAKWILRAFRKCDSRDRVWQVWTELRPRCETDFEPDQVAPFEEFLYTLFKDGYDRRPVRDQGRFGHIERRKAWTDTG